MNDPRRQSGQYSSPIYPPQRVEVGEFGEYGIMLYLHYFVSSMTGMAGQVGFIRILNRQAKCAGVKRDWGQRKPTDLAVPPPLCLASVLVGRRINKRTITINTHSVLLGGQADALTQVMAASQSKLGSGTSQNAP